MANEELTTLYKDVFDQVYPQIRNQNGVLYKVIHILLQPEESKADELCTYIGIKDNASLDDDENIVANLIEKPNLLPLNDNWFKEKLRNVMNPDIAKVAWIVIIACILVGAFVCMQYINNRKQKLRDNARNLQSDYSQPLPAITAALCLVVPASVIIDLKDEHPTDLEANRINTSDLKMLIDHASYFLCTTEEEAKAKEQILEMTNEEIPTNSNREVYIRIHIDKGQEMINKESTYILKRNLPGDGQRIVQRYYCLKNLSGLEKFNRV